MMKTIIYMILMMMCFTSCGNTPEKKKKEMKEKPIGHSTIFFSRKLVNVGDVMVGTTKEITFYAVNRSAVPLVIDSVKSSCSCTIAEFPKNPILKNDSAAIVAYYTPNSSNVGSLRKSIVVMANTKNPFSVLTFEGKVVASR